MSSNHESRHVCGRREFLRSVVAGATAGSIVPLLTTSSRGMEIEANSWKMRLSASSINFKHLPIEQACQRIAELGFEAVDIWSAHEGCPHLDDVLNRLGPEGLKDVLAENKLRLCSFSVYQGGYGRYAELLGRVGGGVAVRGSTRPCPPDELVPRMREFLEGLQEEISLAEQYDSYVAIENHGQALLDSLDSFKAFVDLNRSPRVGIALAPYHLQSLNVSVDEAIQICGRQLFYFYAWQRAEGIEQLPGHGPTNFTPWIAALARTSYGGYVNPFMHGDIEVDAMSEALTKSREYLVRCDEAHGGTRR